jgi:TolA-binding protein
VWLAGVGIFFTFLFGIPTLLPQKVKELKCGRLSPKQDCPLQIDSFSYELSHPEGSDIEGIIWKSHYVDVRVTITNTSVKKIENISFSLIPETHIRKYVQATNIPDVIISPDMGPVKEMAIKIKKENGSHEIIPMPTIGEKIVPAVKLQCYELLSDGEIKIVLACVALNPPVNGKFPKKLMAPRQPPRWIRIIGSYEIIEAGSHKRYHFKDQFQLMKSIDKDNFENLYEKGKALINEKKYLEAIGCLKVAIELKPNSAKAHCNLGNAYSFEGKKELALKEYQEAIRIDPDLAQPHFNLGVMMMDDEQWTQAIEQLEISSRLNHLAIKYDSFIALGICLKRLKRHDDAFEKYKSATNLRPNLAPAYFQWGLDLLDLNKHEEAISKFEIVSKLDSNLRLDALGNWGAALEGMGNIDAALKKYNEVIKIAPNSKHADRSRNSIRELIEKSKNN